MYKILTALSRTRYNLNSFTRSYKRVAQNQKYNLFGVANDTRTKSQTSVHSARPFPVKKNASDPTLSQSEPRVKSFTNLSQKYSQPLLVPKKSKPKVHLVTYSVNPRKLFYSSLVSCTKYGTYSPKKKPFVNKEALELYRNALKQCNRIKLRKRLENTLYQPRTQQKVSRIDEDREIPLHVSEIESKDKANRKAKRKIKGMPLQENPEIPIKLKLNSRKTIPPIHNLDKKNKKAKMKDLSKLSKFLSMQKVVDYEDKKVPEKKPFKVELPLKFKKLKNETNEPKKVKMNKHIINNIIRKKPPKVINLRGEPTVTFRYILDDKKRSKDKLTFKVKKRSEKKSKKSILKITYPANSHIKQYVPREKVETTPSPSTNIDCPLERMISQKNLEPKKEEHAEAKEYIEEILGETKGESKKRIKYHPTLQTITKEDRMEMKKTYLKLLANSRTNTKLSEILQKVTKEMNIDELKASDKSEDPTEDPEVIVVDEVKPDPIIDPKITKHPASIRNRDETDDIKIKYPKKVVSEIVPTFNIEETCIKNNTATKTTVMDNYIPIRDIEEEKKEPKTEIKPVQIKVNRTPVKTPQDQTFLEKIDKEIEKAYEEKDTQPKKELQERPLLFKQLLKHYQKLDTEVTSKLKERNAMAGSLDRQKNTKTGILKPEFYKSSSLDRGVQPVQEVSKTVLSNKRGSKAPVTKVMVSEEEVMTKLKSLKNIQDIKWPTLTNEEKKMYEDLLKKVKIKKPISASKQEGVEPKVVSTKPPLHEKNEEAPKKKEDFPKAEDLEETIAGEIKANIMRINEKKGYIPSHIHPSELEPISHKRSGSRDRDKKLASKVVWPKAQDVEKNFSRAFKEKVTTEVKTRVKLDVSKKNVLPPKVTKPQLVEASMVNVNTFKKITQSCFNEIHNVLMEKKPEISLKKSVIALKKECLVQDKNKPTQKLTLKQGGPVENKSASNVTKTCIKFKEPMCLYSLKVVQVENVGLKLFKETINKLKTTLTESIPMKRVMTLEKQLEPCPSKVNLPSVEKNKPEEKIAKMKSSSIVNFTKAPEKKVEIVKAAKSETQLKAIRKEDTSVLKEAKKEEKQAIQKMEDPKAKKIDQKSTSSDSKFFKYLVEHSQKIKPKAKVVSKPKNTLNDSKTHLKETPKQTLIKQNKDTVKLVKATSYEKVSKKVSTSEMKEKIKPTSVSSKETIVKKDAPKTMVKQQKSVESKQKEVKTETAKKAEESPISRLLSQTKIELASKKKEKVKTSPSATKMDSSKPKADEKSLERKSQSSTDITKKEEKGKAKIYFSRVKTKEEFLENKSHSATNVSKQEQKVKASSSANKIGPSITRTMEKSLEKKPISLTNVAKKEDKVKASPSSSRINTEEKSLEKKPISSTNVAKAEEKTKASLSATKVDSLRTRTEEKSLEKKPISSTNVASKEEKIKASPPSKIKAEDNSIEKKAISSTNVAKNEEKIKASPPSKIKAEDKSIEKKVISSTNVTKNEEKIKASPPSIIKAEDKSIEKKAISSTNVAKKEEKIKASPPSSIIKVEDKSIEKKAISSTNVAKKEEKIKASPPSSIIKTEDKSIEKKAISSTNVAKKEEKIKASPPSSIIKTEDKSIEKKVISSTNVAKKEEKIKATPSSSGIKVEDKSIEKKAISSTNVAKKEEKIKASPPSSIIKTEDKSIEKKAISSINVAKQEEKIKASPSSSGIKSGEKSVEKKPISSTNVVKMEEKTKASLPSSRIKTEKKFLEKKPISSTDATKNAHVSKQLATSKNQELKKEQIKTSKSQELLKTKTRHIKSRSHIQLSQSKIEDKEISHKMIANKQVLVTVQNKNNIFDSKIATTSIREHPQAAVGSKTTSESKTTTKKVPSVPLKPVDIQKNKKETKTSTISPSTHHLSLQMGQQVKIDPNVQQPKPSKQEIPSAKSLSQNESNLVQKSNVQKVKSPSPHRIQEAKKEVEQKDNTSNQLLQKRMSTPNPKKPELTKRSNVAKTNRSSSKEILDKTLTSKRASSASPVKKSRARATKKSKSKQRAISTSKMEKELERKLTQIKSSTIKPEISQKTPVKPKKVLSKTKLGKSTEDKTNIQKDAKKEVAPTTGTLKKEEIKAKDQVGLKKEEPKVDHSKNLPAPLGVIQPPVIISKDITRLQILNELKSASSKMEVPQRTQSAPQKTAKKTEETPSKTLQKPPEENAKIHTDSKAKDAKLANSRAEIPQKIQAGSAPLEAIRPTVIISKEITRLQILNELKSASSKMEVPQTTQSVPQKTAKKTEETPSKTLQKPPEDNAKIHIDAKVKDAKLANSRAEIPQKIQAGSSNEAQETGKVKGDVKSKLSQEKLNLQRDSRGEHPNSEAMSTSQKKIDETDPKSAGNKQYIPPPPKQPPPSEKTEKTKKERPKSNKDVVLPPRSNKMDSVVPEKHQENPGKPEKDGRVQSSTDQTKKEAQNKPSGGVLRFLPTMPVLNYKQISEEVYKKALDYFSSVRKEEPKKVEEKVPESMKKPSVETIMERKPTEEKRVWRPSKEVYDRLKIKDEDRVFSKSLTKDSKEGKVKMAKATEGTDECKEGEKNKEETDKRKEDAGKKKEKQGLKKVSREDRAFLKKLRQRKYHESLRTLEDFEKSASFNIKFGGRFEVKSDTTLESRIGNLDNNFRIPQYSTPPDCWWSKCEQKENNETHQSATELTKKPKNVKENVQKCCAVFKINQEGSYELVKTAEVKTFTEPTEVAFMKRLKSSWTEAKISRKSSSKYCLENYGGELNTKKVNSTPKVKKPRPKFLLEDFKGDIQAPIAEDTPKVLKVQKNEEKNLGGKKDITKKLKAKVCQVFNLPEKNQKKETKTILDIRSDFSILSNDSLLFMQNLPCYSEKAKIVKIYKNASIDEVMLDVKKEKTYRKFNKKLQQEVSKNDLFSGGNVLQKAPEKKKEYKKYTSGTQIQQKKEENHQKIPTKSVPNLHKKENPKPPLVLNIILPKIELPNHLVSRVEELKKAKLLTETNQYSKELEILHKPKEKTPRKYTQQLREKNSKLLKNSTSANSKKETFNRKSKHTKSTLDAPRNKHKKTGNVDKVSITEYIPRKQRIIQSYSMQARIVPPSILSEKDFQQELKVRSEMFEPKFYSTRLQSATNVFVRKTESIDKKRPTTANSQYSSRYLSKITDEEKNAKEFKKQIAKELDKRKSEIKLRKLEANKQLISLKKQIKSEAEIKKVEAKEPTVIKTVIDKSKEMKPTSQVATKVADTQQEISSRLKAANDQKTLSEPSEKTEKSLKDTSKLSKVKETLKVVLYGQSSKLDIDNKKPDEKSATPPKKDKTIKGSSILLKNPKNQTAFSQKSKSSSDICKLCIPSSPITRCLEKGPVEFKSTYDIPIGNKISIPNFKYDPLAKYRHLKITYMQLKPRNRQERDDLPALVIKKSQSEVKEKRNLRRSLSEEDIKVLTLRFEILKRLHEEFSKNTMAHFSKSKILDSTEEKMKTLKGKGRKHPKKGLLKPNDKPNENKPHTRKMSTSSQNNDDGTTKEESVCLTSETTEFDIEKDAPHVFEKPSEGHIENLGENYKNHLYYKYGPQSYYDMYDYLSKLRTFSKEKEKREDNKDGKKDGGDKDDGR